MSDGVLLLHGIARTSKSMRKIEDALRDQGYLTLNLDYDSRRTNVINLAHQVRPQLFAFASSLSGRMHVVAHSMGGLIARLILERPPLNVGKLVQLGTPNRGSEIADLLSDFGPYRRFFGPAGLDLSTIRSEVVLGHLPPLSYPCGVIAGTRALDPLGWLVLPKPNDGRVSTAATKLEGAERLIMPVTHTGMIRNPEVIGQTIHFLREGRFDHK